MYDLSTAVQPIFSLLRTILPPSTPRILTSLALGMWWWQKGEAMLKAGAWASKSSSAKRRKAENGLVKRKTSPAAEAAAILASFFPSPVSPRCRSRSQSVQLLTANGKSRNYGRINPIGHTSTRRGGDRRSRVKSHVTWTPAVDQIAGGICRSVRLNGPEWDRQRFSSKCTQETVLCRAVM